MVNAWKTLLGRSYLISSLSGLEEMVLSTVTQTQIVNVLIPSLRRYYRCYNEGADKMPKEHINNDYTNRSRIQHTIANDLPRMSVA